MSQRHPQSLVRSLAATRRSMGDGTIRGRSRLATPYRRADTRIEIVDQSDPVWPGCVQGCPEPWAWYRGDDLTGFTEGDEVRFWLDRTGGGRDLDDWVDPGATDYPHYTADAVGGQPGITRSENVDDELSVMYDAVTFDAVSLLWVAKAPASGSHAFTMKPLDLGMFGVDLVINDDWVTAWAGGGFADGPHSSPACAVLMVQSATEVRLWVNGTEVVYNFREVPTGPSESWQHTPELSLNTGGGTTTFAEGKIWLVALDDECAQAEMAAAATRYGL